MGHKPTTLWRLTVPVAAFDDPWLEDPPQWQEVPADTTEAQKLSLWALTKRIGSDHDPVVFSDSRGDVEYEQRFTKHWSLDGAEVASAHEIATDTVAYAVGVVRNRAAPGDQKASLVVLVRRPDDVTMAVYVERPVGEKAPEPEMAPVFRRRMETYWRSVTFSEHTAGRQTNVPLREVFKRYARDLAMEIEPAHQYLVAAALSGANEGKDAAVLLLCLDASRRIRMNPSRRLHNRWSESGRWRPVWPSGAPPESCAGPTSSNIWASMHAAQCVNFSSRCAFTQGGRPRAS